MKFTVEIQDFWLEEGELSTELVRQVKNDVVTQIEKSIKDRVDKQIAMEVKAQVEAGMYKLIQSYTQELILSGKVPSRKNRGTEKQIAS